MFADTLFRLRKRTFRTEIFLWIVLEVSGTTITGAFLSHSVCLAVSLSSLTHKVGFLKFLFFWANIQNAVPAKHFLQPLKTQLLIHVFM